MISSVANSLTQTNFFFYFHVTHNICGESEKYKKCNTMTLPLLFQF